MSNLSKIGSLISLYLDDINVVESTDASEFAINAAANVLNQNGGRNWIPLIVKEKGEDKYEAIANHFIYAIAQKAGLKRLWCIIAEDTDNATELSQILAREKMPKINLCTASRDEIKSALQYLIQQPGSNLRTLKLEIATVRIDAADRKLWRTLDPIVNLKCGITRGVKLNALKSVFYLTPEVSETDVARPDIVAPLAKKSLEQMNVTELKNEARKLNIAGVSRMRRSDLIEAISQHKADAIGAG